MMAYYLLLEMCLDYEINFIINTAGCLEHDVARNSQSIPRATSCSRHPNVFYNRVNCISIIRRILFMID